MAGGQTDTRIVKRCFRAAEPQILVFDRNDLVDEYRWIVLDRVHLFRLQPLDNRSLTIHQRQHSGGGVTGEGEVDAGNGGFAFKIAVIGLHHGVVAALFDKLERAGPVEPLGEWSTGSAGYILG
ncbi:hypothetical protein D3C71_1402320 [compost metagenome]